MTSNHGGNDYARRDVLRGLGAIGGIAAFSTVTGANPSRQPGPKPDELVVGTEPTVSTVSAQANVESALATGEEVVHRNDALGYFAVRVPDEAQAQAASSVAKRIERQDGVAYVEPNATYYTQLQPDDAQFASQYAPQQVNAPTAWDTTLGSSDVTVAIVDNGTHYDHQDLQAQFGAEKGRDFVNDDSDPKPGAGTVHGTHVAGIASATTDNGTGVAGMSNSTLLAAQVLGSQGGSLTDIADGIQWTADQGADIINMSLGGGGFSQTLKDAVGYAVSQGALPICAAGNNGSRGVSYPAAYEECVAVSAIDSSENLASFSQYGPSVDVAAPGVDVLATVPSDDYDTLSGTSMACPAASGVAALGLAANPSWGPEELRQNLKSSAVDIGLGDEEQGAGRVDAANIVEGGGDPPDNQAPSASVTASSTDVSVGDTVEFDASGSSDADGSISSYQWSFGDGDSASGATVSHSYSSTGDYTATVTVTDDDGATDSASVTVSVTSDGGGGGCDAPAWDPDEVYSGGDQVSHDGFLWEANWWTQGDEPGAGGQWGPWEQLQECDGGEDPPSNEAPSASVTASSTDVTVGDSVEFDATGSTDADGSIASYDWVFGDGSSASGATVSHSYSSTGDYTATVTVTDDDGATDSASVTVSVSSDGGGGGCDAPAYSDTTVYQAGDRVTYQGSLWEAQLATMANPPSEGNSYWSKVRDC